ncbi:MAG: VIT1/CCC1 transporter family protein [Bacteroidota bacterium]
MKKFTPKKDTKLEHEHTEEAIRERISRVKHSYVRDWIYGGIDGTVTTFAIVSGVAGAELSSLIVLILGFANLIADGFSMAASNYLGTRAEQDDYRRTEAIEQRHIELAPEGEMAEIREIYSRKGFKGADLEKVVEVITNDKKRWVATMLAEEYGLAAEVRSPLKAAFATFTAFIVCGFVPMAPYLFSSANAFNLSALMTLIGFFIIGSVKSIWSNSRWWKSGLETVLIGAIAAGLAYGTGVFLKNLVGE